jgi:flagellar hook-basal body complex protein FliE
MINRTAAVVFPALPKLQPLGKPAETGSFTDTLKGAVGEVAKLNNDARHAVEDLAANRTDDLAGVMTAVEKGDLALKTLLAVRTKLMTAYEEVRNMPI